MNTIGRHYIVEASGCNPNVLNDINKVEEILIEAARQANATVVTSTFHHFYPQGVSGVVVVSESHLAIHTWPERGYAALDIYTCGDHTDPKKAVDYVVQHLGAKDVTSTFMLRGIENSGSYEHIMSTTEEKEDSGEKLAVVF
ncbi:adenosylmethionine decarboxylase [Coprothermobacteraceae bacterium]|nr:adenosylmethionine decarboxylase [Coprothermobacteraceae bacterium]